MKNPPPMMTEKMPTTKPPHEEQRRLARKQPRRERANPRRSITVLHPDAHVFLGESKRDRERHVLAITVHEKAR